MEDITDLKIRLAKEIRINELNNELSKLKGDYSLFTFAFAFAKADLICKIKKVEDQINELEESE